MERTLTQEERIRRAEEIYLRRRNSKPQYRETRENSRSKTVPTVKNIKLFKKMALQMIICLLLYCVFYLIYDANYSFSDTTINKTQEVLNYDINFDEIYKYISEKVMSFINIKDDKVEENKQEDTENTNNPEDTNNEQNNTNEVQQDGNVTTNVITPPPEEQGNVQETPPQVEQTSAVEPDLRQMYSLILPVKRWIYIIRIWGKRCHF